MYDVEALLAAAVHDLVEVLRGLVFTKLWKLWTFATYLGDHAIP